MAISPPPPPPPAYLANAAPARPPKSRCSSLARRGFKLSTARGKVRSAACGPKDQLTSVSFLQLVPPLFSWFSVEARRTLHPSWGVTQQEGNPFCTARPLFFWGGVQRSTWKRWIPCLRKPGAGGEDSVWHLDSGNWKMIRFLNDAKFVFCLEFPQFVGVSHFCLGLGSPMGFPNVVGVNLTILRRQPTSRKCGRLDVYKELCHMGLTSPGSIRPGLSWFGFPFTPQEPGHVDKIQSRPKSARLTRTRTCISSPSHQSKAKGHFTVVSLFARLRNRRGRNRTSICALRQAGAHGGP